MDFENGKILHDKSDNILHAHGGQIIFHEGIYYWIGENRLGRNKVSCYASTDLCNWTFKNNIMTIESPYKKHYVRTYSELFYPEISSNIGKGCNIERPKVIYNESTKKFVMWMHWEMPDNYNEARCAIAICNTIDGNYTYLGSFNPIGHMSRDCTLFKDDDGTAYFISTARNNADINIYRLSKDYLSIDEHVKTLWPGQYREAPTVFKRNGYYYMLTSACTGWTPNQSAYAYSTSITGSWSMLYDFGNETTFKSQPTWVLPIKNDNCINYYYIGDRWEGGLDAYYNSTYVILPIKFKNDTTININYKEKVKILLQGGKLNE